MTDLEVIVKLSHEFGSADYVKGGGGNTSVKNDRTLWVKPSGTTLGGLTTETFVAMNRAAKRRRIARSGPRVKATCPGTDATRSRQNAVFWQGTPRW